MKQQKVTALKKLTSDTHFALLYINKTFNMGSLCSVCTSVVRCLKYCHFILIILYIIALLLLLLQYCSNVIRQCPGFWLLSVIKGNLQVDGCSTAMNHWVLTRLPPQSWHARTAWGQQLIRVLYGCMCLCVCGCICWHVCLCLSQWDLRKW